MSSIRVLSYLALLTIVIGVLSYSISIGNLFFIDSRTYLNFRVKELGLTQTLYIYPYGTILVASVSCLAITYVARFKPILSLFFFASPYQLLLLTNITKESIFFLSIVLYIILSYSKGIFRHLRLLPFIVFIGRPIYMALYYLRLRGIPVILLALTLLYFFDAELLDKFISEFTRRTTDRSSVTHNNGRPFFIYYCIKEKECFICMIKCLLPGMFFAPCGTSYGFMDYIIYSLFQLSFWIVVIGLFLNKYFYLIIIFITGYFLIFLMAPTFGSFIRYYYPLIWLFGALAYVLPNKESPRLGFKKVLTKKLSRR